MKTVVLAGTLWMLTGFVSVQLGQHGETSRPGSSDALYRLIGGFKEAIGDVMYQKADSYYHGGARAESHSHDPSDHEHDNHHSGPWYKRISSMTQIQTHRHLDVDEEAEIIPFLFASTRLNPHHIDGILTESYWIGTRFEKKDEAIELLLTAVKNNPDSWKLYNALAKLYYDKEDYVNSAKYFDLTVQKTKLVVLDPTEERLLHLIYMNLAQSQEHLGLNEEAISNYRHFLESAGESGSSRLRTRAEERIQQLTKQRMEGV